MKLLSLPAAAALLLISAAPAPAAISVDFSGGNGSPLSFTLPAISWTINNARDLNAAHLFGVGIRVGQISNYVGAGSLRDGDAIDWASSSAITFSPAASSFYENFGGDIVWFGMNTNQDAVNGEIVTFTGGTMASSFAVAASFADGNYEVYLMSPFGRSISAEGVAAVPEASSALLGAIGALGLLLRRRSGATTGDLRSL